MKHSFSFWKLHVNELEWNGLRYSLKKLTQLTRNLIDLRRIKFLKLFKWFKLNADKK